MKLNALGVAGREERAGVLVRFRDGKGGEQAQCREKDE
jgi:hypothetical protein